MADSSRTEDLNVYLTGLAIHGYVYRSAAVDRVFLSLPERLPHQQRHDSRMHICKGSETLFDIANMYYPRARRPVDYAQVIAQFQEDPVIDLLLPLDVNRIIMVPSEEYIQDIAYGSSLTEYPVL